MAPSSDSESAVTGATRAVVLEAVRQASEPLTVQQLADRLGLHSNTVRFHIGRLLQSGLLLEEQAESSGRGRPSMVYTAAMSAEAGNAEPQDGYRFLAEILASHFAATSPAPVDAAVSAGSEWGRYLTDRPLPFSQTTDEEAIEKVVVLLRRLGFAPKRNGEERRVLLHRCPFRAVADQRPDIVCSIHLGLMRGAIAEMGAPIEVTDLVRAEAPLPCIAHLSSPGKTSTGHGQGR